MKFDIKSQLMSLFKISGKGLGFLISYTVKFTYDNLELRSSGLLSPCFISGFRIIDRIL
jgi:hypothetical protein